MHWVLEHLQVLVVIAVAVAAMLQKMKAFGSGQGARKSAPADRDAEERTRRIQAEIRRRIMERRGLAPAEPSPSSGVGEAAPSIFPPPLLVEEVRPVVISPPPATVMMAKEEPALSAEVERHQRLLRQLQEFESSRVSRSGSAQASMPADARLTANAPAGDWRTDLRSAGGLRRALVLREILGPPRGVC